MFLGYGYVKVRSWLIAVGLKSKWFIYILPTYRIKCGLLGWDYDTQQLVL